MTSWRCSAICSAVQTASERRIRSGLAVPVICRTKPADGVGRELAVGEQVRVGPVAADLLVLPVGLDEPEEGFGGERAAPHGGAQCAHQGVSRVLAGGQEDTVQIGFECVQQGEPVVGLSGFESEPAGRRRHREPDRRHRCRRRDGRIRRRPSGRRARPGAGRRGPRGSSRARPCRAWRWRWRRRAPAGYGSPRTARRGDGETTSELEISHHCRHISRSTLPTQNIPFRTRRSSGRVRHAHNG